ncbi:hypothetical protein ACXO88_08085, partial [Lactobacillus delbrueckii subsp. bulgaricus]
FFLRQSPSDVKQEKQMSSILYDQLQSAALRQYIKQLSTKKLQHLIKNPDISEADLKLILKNTENETIKQLATEKLQHLNSQAIQESLNFIHKLGDNWKGWATSIARGQSINELKYRYKNASPDEKAKIRDILRKEAQ